MAKLADALASRASGLNVRVGSRPARGIKTMSLPHEKKNALKAALKLLYDLADGTLKRVPKGVRERARYALRHYPSEAEIDHETYPSEGL